MKKRMIIIIMIVLVIGILAGGAIWYHKRMNTGIRLLAKAEVALKAKNFARAAQLAGRYVSDNPDKWRGHHDLGEAYLRLGRYEEARKAFIEASRLNPGKASAILGISNSYSFAGAKILSKRSATLDVKSIADAIDLIAKANEVLLKARLPRPEEALDVRERIGMNYRTLAAVWLQMSLRHSSNADAAASPALAAARRDEERKAQIKSDNLGRQAIEVLLAVVIADPKRSRAAEVLLDLCVHTRDDESLAKAHEAILAIESPPPIAAARLLLLDIRASRDLPDAFARRKIRTKACAAMDKLLANHPDLLEVKLARAEAGLLVNDLPTVERICDEVLKANSQHQRARLTKAHLLMQQGQFDQAERMLYVLRSEMPTAADVHYSFAIAAMATGKLELARDAMREVTQLSPNHAGARRFLAQELMRGKHYIQAFTDAEAYYSAHKDDPIAVRLFVEVAMRTDQPKLAADTLAKARKDHGDDPEMLMAIAVGYSIVREPAKAAATLALVAEMKPATGPEIVAVAKALRLIKRTPEAEKLVTEGLRRDPQSHRLHFELGQIFASTGRNYQAAEQLRQALKIDKRNDKYHLALAQVLFKSGDIDQCESVLEDVHRSNAQANLLRLQLRLIRGESIPPEQMLEYISSQDRAATTLAITYFSTGRPDRCIEVCVAELLNTPQNHALRFLLGQAYLVQGRKKECLEQWRAVVEAVPDELPTYLRIAGVLEADRSLDEMVKEMLEIPGARRDMVELTIGWLAFTRRDYKASARIYRTLAAREDAPVESRSRARLLAAQALASAGQVDQAIIELNAISSPAFARIAMETKVSLLIAAFRWPEAAETIGKLHEMATAKSNATLLRRIVGMYARVNQPDKALAVTDEIIATLPNDARSYLLQAGLLSGMNQRTKALPLLRKAIQLQPGNFRSQVSLINTLDLEQQPRKALDVLDAMEQMGRAGKIRALFERGKLLATWGLAAEARRCFEELSQFAGQTLPAIQLATGQSLAQLGQKQRAKDILKGISPYSAQYVKARQTLAAMGESDQEQLDILAELEQSVPGIAQVLVQKMDILMRAKRYAESTQAFKAFIAKPINDRSGLRNAHLQAVISMLHSGDLKGAAELSKRAARITGLIQWRYLAIILAIDQSPDEAAAMLSKLEEADTYEALLALVIATKRSDPGALAKWADRFENIVADRASADGSKPIPKLYELLAFLIAGKESQIRSGIQTLMESPFAGKGVIAELVAGSRGKPDEVAELLKTTLAISLGLKDLAHTWAMQTLKGRNDNQFAAALAAQTSIEASQLKEVLDILKPTDSVLGMTIKASILSAENHHDQAARMYEKAVQVEPDNAFLKLRQAMSTENAGQFVKALSLYREIWAATKSPVAANNAAYLVSLLHPNDTAKLTEALVRLDEAIVTAPRAAAFRDSKAWISFLLGKKEQAQRESRGAIRGLRSSPEAHYHLGVIEGDAGDTSLSRWHLTAAVSNAKVARDAGRHISPAAAKAAELAAKALAELPDATK